MKILKPNIESLFNIASEDEFNSLTLDSFRYQYSNNTVYRQFVDLLKINPIEVTSIEKIPFLPIGFFKTHSVLSENSTQITFKSSGTTGQERSKHKVSDISIYEQSFHSSFQQFYGKLSEYAILGLLPSYLEQGDSSLVYMIQDFVAQTHHNGSGFYLNNFSELNQKIKELESRSKKYILLGVSYALLDFCEQFPQQISSGIIMETGGMKGRRKELTKSELHQELSTGFGVSSIHSEYGMTELLSQAYSYGKGIYQSPKWMKVLTRSTTDPLSLISKKRGLLNIIDLANINSCSFIATDDLGVVYPDNSFEVIGRFDTSEIRGCNLMVG